MEDVSYIDRGGTLYDRCILRLTEEEHIYKVYLQREYQTHPQ